jgi:hypothetical protein
MAVKRDNSTGRDFADEQTIVIRRERQASEIPVTRMQILRLGAVNYTFTNVIGLMHTFHAVFCYTLESSL